MCGLTDNCKTQKIEKCKKKFHPHTNETTRREEKKKFFFFFFVLRSFCVRMKMQNENDEKMEKDFMSFFLKVK